MFMYFVILALVSSNGSCRTSYILTGNKKIYFFTQFRLPFVYEIKCLKYFCLLYKQCTWLIRLVEKKVCVVYCWHFVTFVVTQKFSFKHFVNYFVTPFFYREFLIIVIFQHYHYASVSAGMDILNNRCKPIAFFGCCAPLNKTRFSKILKPKIFFNVTFFGMAL